LNNLSAAKLDQINNPSVLELTAFVGKNSVVPKIVFDRSQLMSMVVLEPRRINTA
jgi:hypothetical protein